MKNTFDSDTRKEIFQRISHLHKNSVPVWGKMTVYQRVLHGTKWEEILPGKT